MICHQFIAILTSERAAIQDTEVNKLATGIIEAQRIEIAEMQATLERLRKSSLITILQGLCWNEFSQYSLLKERSFKC
jgi:hypothetical protein